MGVDLCVSATPLRGIRTKCGHDEKYIRLQYSPKWDYWLLLHDITKASQRSIERVEQSSRKHLIVSVMIWDALQMQLLTEYPWHPVTGNP